MLAYAWLVRRYRRCRRCRRRAWPVVRTLWFACGLATALVAVASPLEVASDRRFAWHMVQHVVLTDVTAPCLLLGAPLLLVLASVPVAAARRIVRFLRGPAGATLANPLVSWSVFVLALWLPHFTGFFEAALEHEPLHVLEHALYVGAALLFWFPVVAIGPTPWAQGPLAYPLRMFYLFMAMPAEGMLGFAINASRHVLYPHYARAGIEDQRAAGEIMWVGGTLTMFVAFMCVGYAWGRQERRLGERADRLVAP